ncbi:MAG: hypothetical protein R2824_24080 [Saprospiraceae bacterium]
MSNKLDHKTAVIAFITALIGLIVVLIPILFSNKEPNTSQSGSTEGTDNVAVNPPTPETQEIDDGDNKEPPHTAQVGVTSLPSQYLIDTVQLLLDARFSNSLIELDGNPAKIIKRSSIIAFVLVPRIEDNHTFSVKDGDRVCEVTSHINSNRTITINLTNCK